MQKLTPAIINILCQRFSLGDPIDKPKMITGGLLNRLWRLTTTQGIFAIKCIDESNTIALQHNRLDPEQSQQVATFMLEKQVPTVVALQHEKQYSLEIENSHFLVMKWLDGELLAIKNVTVAMTEKIGHMLAQIHQANYDQKNDMPNWCGLSEHEWRALMNYPELNTILSPQLTNLVAWSQQASDSIPLLQRDLIFSHRDLDAKNVLWQDASQPILLDWEYAGMINTGLDLLIVCLNWSGVLEGYLDLEKCRAIIKGYAQSQPLPNMSSTTFGGYYGYCLDWLTFNLRKFIRHKSSKYPREIKRSLRAILLVHKQQASILKLFAPPLSA